MYKEISNHLAVNIIVNANKRKNKKLARINIKYY